MNYQKLQDFISNKINGEDFIFFHENEILNYINNSSDKDIDSVPIYSNVSLSDFKVEDLIYILELYLNDDIFEWDLEYLLSFLELSYIGENEKIEEVIFNFANPYLNYYISKENISQAIKYLKNKNLNLYLEGVNIRKKQKGRDYRPNYKSKILQPNM